MSEENNYTGMDQNEFMKRMKAIASDLWGGIVPAEEEKPASQRQRQRKSGKTEWTPSDFPVFSLARPWHNRAFSLIHQGFWGSVQSVSMSFPKTLLAH